MSSGVVAGPAGGGTAKCEEEKWVTGYGGTGSILGPFSVSTHRYVYAPSSHIHVSLDRSIPPSPIFLSLSLSLSLSAGTRTTRRRTDRKPSAGAPRETAPAAEGGGGGR